jgi:hypothetical protein
LYPCTWIQASLINASLQRCIIALEYKPAWSMPSLQPHVSASHTSATIHQCINASLQPHISASHTSALVHQCISASVHQSINASLQTHISASVHQCNHTPVHQCISASMHASVSNRAWRFLTFNSAFLQNEHTWSWWWIWVWLQVRVHLSKLNFWHVKNRHINYLCIINTFVYVIWFKHLCMSVHRYIFIWFESPTFL